MSALNREDNYAGRVNYAAAVIIAGREPTRNFDNCFENYDGEIVATALWRRAQKNPRLAQNLPRYLAVDLCEKNAQEFAHIPTRKLGEAAAAIRARKQAEADAAHARFLAEKEAERQACEDAGYTVRHFPDRGRWAAYRPDGSLINDDCYWQDNAWYMAECDMKRQSAA